MFWNYYKMFPVLLSNIFNGSNHASSMSLSNQRRMIQPTLISLHPSECSQEFHYHPFVVKLDICVRSCNTLNDLSDKLCVPNETKNLNLSLFNMISGINESKTLTKDIWKKNIIQIIGGLTINVDVSVRNAMYVKKIMFGILLHVVVKTENI